MKTTTHNEVSSPTSVNVSKETPSKQSYNVVIVYDEFAAGQRAVETCHRLIAPIKDDVNVRVKVWSFAVLRNTAVNLTAASDAAKAQMVMVASSREELPPAVKKWIEAWMVWTRKVPAMLVGILDGSAAREDYSSAEAYLRFVAASRGMEFVLEKNDTRNSAIFFRDD